jgi:hypothetical protein
VTVSDSAGPQETPPHTQTPTGSTARTAAFFDLDKTVIAKSSTLAFSKPFFDQGLLNRRSVLKSSYAQFLFTLSGADHDQMDRMRVHLTHMSSRSSRSSTRHCTASSPRWFSRRPPT